MCLIVHRPKDSQIERSVIDNAYRSNDDGFGLMYTDGSGKVTVVKGLYNQEQIHNIWKHHEKYDFAVHFRMATHGEISPDNSHPYQLSSKEKHGRDMWLMHNGVLSNMRSIRGRGRSDTGEFVEDYLGPVLQRDPGLIDDPEFRNLVSTAIGSYNKLLVMDGEGKVFIFNEKSGVADQGGWFSNSMYKGYGRSYGMYDWD